MGRTFIPWLLCAYSVKGVSRQQQLARAASPMCLRPIPATDGIVTVPCAATTALPTQRAGTTIRNPGQGPQALPDIQPSLRLIPFIRSALLHKYFHHPKWAIIHNNARFLWSMGSWSLFCKTLNNIRSAINKYVCTEPSLKQAFIDISKRVIAVSALNKY